MYSFRSIAANTGAVVDIVFTVDSPDNAVWTGVDLLKFSRNELPTSPTTASLGACGSTDNNLSLLCSNKRPGSFWLSSYGDGRLFFFFFFTLRPGAYSRLGAY